MLESLPSKNYKLISFEKDVAAAYHRLSPPAATLLRRLGVLPVAEFPGWLAEPLLDDGRQMAERALAELLDAGLLSGAPARYAGPRRYRMSEPVRRFARDRLQLDLPHGNANAA